MKRRRSYSYGKSYNAPRGKRRRSNSYKRPSVARTRGAAVNTERKYYDLTIVPTAIPKIVAGNNWVNTRMTGLPTLCAPVQGSGVFQRDGQKIYLHKIYIRGTIKGPEFNGGTDNSIVRLLLVQDTQTNAANFAETECIASNSSGSGLAFNDFQNTANFGRFRVLKDIRLKINFNCSFWNATLASEVSPGSMTAFKIVHKFKRPLLIRYNNSNNGNVSDIVDHSFHLLAAQQNDQGPVQNLDAQCRAYFTDP